MIGAVFADVVGRVLIAYCCSVRKFLGYGVLLVWCCLGFTQEGYLFVGRMEKLVGKVLFEYLEFGTTLCDVGYLEGAQ